MDAPSMGALDDGVAHPTTDNEGEGMTDVLGLQGKRTLVVGGGSGIGRATAALLGRAGAEVAVADLDGERASAVAEEVGGHAIVGDVLDEAGATAVVDQAHEVLGGLAGVVNIIGLASWSDLMSVDLATWEADIRMNLTQHLLVGRAAARHMMREGGGALAMVTSVSGIYGAPLHAAYGAAKAGAISLVRSMTNEWSPHGIRINSVAPDIIATPRVVAAYHEGGGNDMNEAARRDRVPLARFGTPEEIAGPLVFLISDLSSFMTGQCLIVDGGTHALFPHAGGMTTMSASTPASG
jgi:NAD(P)-dependent dehydrogenase (short-subunit alcohol dehydrogenase family)